MEAARLDIAPCADGDVLRLARELTVSNVTAQVLARRGLVDPAKARSFLAADQEHSCEDFDGIEEVVGLVRAHLHARSRITVHGDYDVDGVCSTAVLVRALRRLGAEVDWYLPDRSSDGYGLNGRTVARLAGRGTRLLIAVDCGITALEELAAARAAGMDVIVADHHTPGSGGLPEAAIVHPRVCGYPCPDLCATAIAYKLAQALTSGQEAAAQAVQEDLDLVALATIADSVPLRGENRTLARRGLRALARTLKPGLRALMARARVDPGRLDERAVSFGLAPRLNAAGRLYRADAALELLLCEDPVRAAQIAEELDRANEERRDAETRVLFEAEALLAELPPRSGYVLAGEGWHGGVIGIVASRLVERHNRPFALVALAGDSGKGSARSIERLDLLGALAACDSHLRRYGGHRAAAGLELDRAALADFAAAFDAHVASALSADDLAAVVRVDAIASGGELSLELAEELRSLAPFGQGNPAVSLLLRASRVSDLRTMGEGRHLRFTLHADGSRMNAVAFGFGGRSAVRRELAREGAFDGVFRLEVNEWNGLTEPRLNLVHVQPCAVLAEPIGIGEGVPYPLRDARGDRTLAG
jgi:single-stranded-DNA-specific exonuclease